MSEPAWQSSIKDALADLDMAYLEAEAELPEEIKREHALMVMGGHVVDPWHVLEWRHQNIPALDALAFIAEFRAKAKGLQIRTEATSKEASRVANGQEKYDLRVGKHRQR